VYGRAAQAERAGAPGYGYNDFKIELAKRTIVSSFAFAALMRATARLDRLGIKGNTVDLERAWGPTRETRMADRTGGTGTDDAGRWKYGLWVVFAGLAVILVAFGGALVAFSEAADVSTALAPVTGVVGTIVGAYFGVQAGAAGKDKAEEERAQATELAHHALGALPEDKAEKVMQAAGGP
jgi:uncharacterized membrane protein YbhN (UPF0104 family)